MTAQHIYTPTHEQQTAQVEALRALLGANIVSEQNTKGELVFFIASGDVEKCAYRLKANGYQQLIDITAVDRLADAKRFTVVYNFLSLTENRRVRLHTQVGEGESVPSLVNVYAAAGWFEREVFDMYGVAFAGNPDLRRILTDYGFEGHPQRKDFPLTGYTELRYDNEQRRIVSEAVTLVQDFRNFDFESPWDGMTGVQLPGDEKAVKPLTAGRAVGPAEIKPIVEGK